MRHTLTLLLPALLALLATACGGQGEPVVLHRFEQLLFDTPQDRLQQTLAERHAEYSSPLLNVLPDDSRYMAMLNDFVADPEVRHIYHTTDSLYHDLGWLAQELGNAFGRLGNHCPDISYQRFYTLITGDFQDYPSRIFCSGNDLAISIDRYAIGALADRYHYGLPTYLVGLCTRDHIAADCIAAAVREHTAIPDGDMTLLDQMVAEGKVLYMQRLALPDRHDTILLRYTAGQLAWMQDNVASVWAWLIEGNLLYSTDIGQMRNLIDDAPKTNAFGEGSAPRTTAYIGWQIVDRYMRKNSVNPTELLADTDSRRILNLSGWRP